MGRSRPGRHGLRHRPPQPPQVVLAAARGRRARAPGRSRSPTGSRPSCRCRGSSAARASNGAGPQLRPRLRRARSRSAACAASRATSASSSAPTPTSAQPRRRRPAGGLRDRGAERQLPAGEARSRAAPASTCRSPSTARCMHEFVLSGEPGQARAGGEDARHRQAPARLRLPPADGLLPAAGRRGADGRADRDRDARVARRASPRRSTRSSPRPRRTRRSLTQRALHDAGAPPRRGAAQPQARSSASRSELGKGSDPFPKTRSSRAARRARSGSGARPGRARALGF